MSDKPSNSESVLQSVQFIRITGENAGQRIDNFLLKKLNAVPKSHIYRLLRTGQVRVNGGRKKPVYKLRSGDDVRIPPVVVRRSEKITIPDDVIRRVTGDVVFEDDDLIVLNKKPGLAVHAGSGLRFGLIDALRQSRSDTALELIHRLDRETSGCLLIAKNRRCLLQLQDAFRNNRVSKQYLALTMGFWDQKTVTINQPLKKNIEQGGERIVKIDPTGKSAITHFSVIRQFKQCALVRVQIETGRTHQIRVHAASLGHAVVGDLKYGNKTLNLTIKKQGLKRMYLHAEKMEILDIPDYRFSVVPDSTWQRDLQSLQELSD